MKILHIARERRAAVVAERLIHGIAHDVTLMWAPTPASALHWLQDNRDTAAVIAEVEALTCASFVEQLRGLGLPTPVIVVAGASRPHSALIALTAGADGYVAAGPSLEAALPRAVNAAIDSERHRRQLVTQLLTEFGVGREQAETPATGTGEARLQIEQQAASAVTDAAATWFAGVEAGQAVARARDTRIAMALQQRLFELESTLRKADERQASEAVSFADQLAKRHAEFTASLTQAAHARDAVAAELSGTTAALEEARQARRADAAAATEHLRRREAELQAELAATAAGRTAIENALAEAEAAHQDTRERAATDLAAANERQAALEDLLAQETDRRTSLDRKLTAAEAAHQEANRRHTAEQAAAANALTQLQARYERAVEENAAARAEIDAARSREAELIARLTSESEARMELEGDLAAARVESARGRDRTRHVISMYRRRVSNQNARLTAELDELRLTIADEREAHERTRLTGASELQQISDEYGHMRQSFDQLQSAFHTLEEIAGEHASERTRLEAVVADRDSLLSAQAEHLRVVEESAEDALNQVLKRVRQTLETRDTETARLQQDIAALRRELDASRTHAEALRGVAERVPDLQTQLERSQHERRRQFERAPYALCRCSPSGAITEANHTFVTLLGCRRVDELQNKDFVAAALDRAGDLGWLLDRARTTTKTETVETQWKTRDGRSLLVRLQALATSAGSIDIVAEDITGVRTLEERLRQSQRLEAVGRLAPEVAGTCEALLSDVASGAREWLVKAGSDPGLRWHAERLLTDVTRAAAFMRQLGKYGDEQVRALEPVSAQRVLRDLAPVLQRLVGDQIDLVLPKSSGSFTVDVDAERLERVLINVAGYARERIPAGGQVRIDLATTAVGRRFAAGYSNVRPGDHVLITVTELPTTADPRVSSERRRRSDKPGVDLGVLVDLIASCGGHLWLEAQPAGNMVVKIHLPKPSAATADESRSGRLSRWFRSPSAARIHA